MTPTTPIGPRGPKELTPAASKPAHPAAAATETAHTTDSHVLVAESVGKLHDTVTNGQEQVHRADREMIDKLKAAIRDGTFTVSVDELAERLVADAFGDEGATE